MLKIGRATWSATLTAADHRNQRLLRRSVQVGRPPRPKANLERLLERRPEGVFVNAFEIGLMKRAAAAIGAR